MQLNGIKEQIKGFFFLIFEVIDIFLHNVYLFSLYILIDIIDNY